MRSLRSLLPVAVISLALVGAATSPAAASPVHGRGLHAQAGLYAGILDDGRARIQILDRLCENPEHQRRCTAVKASLERAVDRAVDRPIIWVDRPDRHGGVFWVLAPVRLGAEKAKLRWAWRDLTPYGCSGGGRLTYTRDRGAWRLWEGIEYEGCPASPGSSA